MRYCPFVEMNRISLVALSIFAFLFLSPPATAEKAPVWEWDSSTGISHVAISEDSRNVSATYASTVSIWYNHTSIPQKNKVVESQITSMAMSSDGKSVLIGEELDTTVTLYEEGSKMWETSDFFTVADVDISPNGSHIAVADWRSIHFFTRDSNEAVWSHYHEDEYMTTVSISPDGLFIAIGTQNGKVFLYPASGDNSSSGLHDKILDGDIVGIDFSADSSRLIIGTEIGNVYVYETEGGAQVMDLAYQEEISCVSGSSDSDHYAFGTATGSVVVINSSMDSIKWQKNIGDAITALDFNGVGTHLIAGTNNKIVVLAKVSDGDELWRTTASGKVSGVAMSYRGENIVVGTDEGLAIYYEQQLDNQAPIATIDSITPAIALPGTLINMNGSAFDLDGEVVDYLWYSSVDGNLSNERRFTVSNLSLGLHVITFSAQDNEGRWSKGASQDIGVGDFPEAEIVSVSDCDLVSVCVISEGSTIEFAGSAVSKASNDTEVIGYYWMSDIDGPLSNQTVFSIANLSRGSHTITLRAVNDIGFWSSNVTMSLLINGVPVSSIVSADPNPVQPGEDIFLVASGTDPDGGSLTYIWSSATLLFANGQTSYESDKTGSKVETSESDFGVHEISLRVVDPYGIYSEISKVSIEILSFPLVSAVCDEEAVVDEELLFTAVASDRLPGRIVLYEWDFDTSSGDIESVDFEGAEYATHSYDSVPESSFYTVVVRVTDDDGLVARDTCTVDMLAKSTSSPQEDSSFFDDGLGSISELASPPVIAGIGSTILIIGAVAYYMMRRDDMTNYAPTTRSQSVSSSDYMRSRVPDVSPVRQSQLLEEEFETDTMTIECPECSARMDIPNVSGTQHIQCAECGIEGEIDL
ncbi:MAG: hypothetical protein VX188_02560 [Candidatus Thermoplasmatota archaeon]|nr:hypothetical protein [Candidatus Thermoplasmatota archaeon]